VDKIIDQEKIKRKKMRVVMMMMRKMRIIIKRILKMLRIN